MSLELIICLVYAAGTIAAAIVAQAEWQNRASAWKDKASQTDTHIA